MEEAKSLCNIPRYLQDNLTMLEEIGEASDKVKLKKSGKLHGVGVSERLRDLPRKVHSFVAQEVVQGTVLHEFHCRRQFEKKCEKRLF